MQCGADRGPPGGGVGAAGASTRRGAQREAGRRVCCTAHPNTRGADHIQCVHFRSGCHPPRPGRSGAAGYVLALLVLVLALAASWAFPDELRRVVDQLRATWRSA